MPATADPLGTLARHWWVLAVLGALNLVAGVLAITHPGFTLQVVGIVVGIYLLLAALAAILAAAAGDPASRGPTLVVGVAALIAGLIFVRHPGNSLLALVVAAGIYLVVVGVLRVVAALELRSGRTAPLALGALDAVLGILLLAIPDVGLGTLALLVGLSMLLHGARDLASAFGLRRLRGADADSSPTAGFAT
jgi:uncharacterized membrane protein HdeD (DUF308 family)